MNQKKAKLIKEYCRQTAYNPKRIKKEYKAMSHFEREEWSKMARRYIEA